MFTGYSVTLSVSLPCFRAGVHNIKCGNVQVFTGQDKISVLNI